MTVIYTSRNSRRSTILKTKFHKCRSRVTATHRTNLSCKLKSNSKTTLHYISSWMNRWSLVHFIMLFICILIHYCPSLINSSNAIFIKSTYRPNNKTSIKHEYLTWIHYDWCSSSSGLVNNTSSYAFINQSIIFLGATCCTMFILALLLYLNLNEESTDHSSSHFWYGFLILIMFAGSSICNQLISTLSCRPIEILYDMRYTSMLACQILGFIVCLCVAYGLGTIFTPLFDQRRTTLSTLDNRAPLFPLLKKLYINKRSLMN